jgi:hypothetical protein
VKGPEVDRGGLEKASPFSLRDQWFESISLQRRVPELSVPLVPTPGSTSGKRLQGRARSPGSIRTSDTPWRRDPSRPGPGFSAETDSPLHAACGRSLDIARHRAQSSAIAAAVASLPARQAYLDGELCGIRSDGTTSFSLIQNASDTGNGDALVFFLFDILHLDGETIGVDLDRVPKVITEIRWPNSRLFARLSRKSAARSSPQTAVRRWDSSSAPDRSGPWLREAAGAIVRSLSSLLQQRSTG